MFKKIPDFMLWIILAAAVAAVPLACSSDSTTSTDARDRPADMTGGN